MNLGRVGGILEAKKIASLAEVFYTQIAPHLYNGPVGAAASIQLATATPNFLIMESIKTWDGFHEEVLMEPLNWVNGNIIPSDKPGLGVELNLEVVRSNSPYKGKKLHLSMDSNPYYVEEGFDLLLHASEKYNCTSCKVLIQNFAGPNYNDLLLQLF